MRPLHIEFPIFSQVQCFPATLQYFKNSDILLSQYLLGAHLRFLLVLHVHFKHSSHSLLHAYNEKRESLWRFLVNVLIELK